MLTFVGVGVDVGIGVCVAPGVGVANIVSELLHPVKKRKDRKEIDQENMIFDGFISSLLRVNVIQI